MALSRLAPLIGKCSSGWTRNIAQGLLRPPTPTGPLPSVLQARQDNAGEACGYPISKQSPRALSRTWAALVSFPRLIAAPHSSLCHWTLRTIRQTSRTETQQGFLPLTSSSSSNMPHSLLALPSPVAPRGPSGTSCAEYLLTNGTLDDQQRASALAAGCSHRPSRRSRSPDPKQRG